MDWRFFIKSIHLSKFLLFSILFSFSFTIRGMESCDSTKMSTEVNRALKEIIWKKFNTKIKSFFHSIGGLEGEPKKYDLEIEFFINLEERYESSSWPQPSLNPNPITVRLKFNHKTSSDSNLSNYYFNESSGYLYHSGAFVIDLEEVLKRDWEGNVLKRTCEFKIGRVSNIEIYNRTQRNFSLGGFYLFNLEENLMSLEMNPNSKNLNFEEEF